MIGAGAAAVIVMLGIDPGAMGATCTTGEIVIEMPPRHAQSTTIRVVTSGDTATTTTWGAADNRPRDPMVLALAHQPRSPTRERALRRAGPPEAAPMPRHGARASRRLLHRRAHC